ncbi:MAG: diacylglycerol/lipid kinase family protein [Thermomicrobiales bacterium]
MSTAHTVRARLITNPNSGRGGIDLSGVLPTLDAHGWDVEVCKTERPGHATELAAEAVADGVAVVIACGGDGTLGETVDGVIGSDAAVGVLPGGTANLWAREVGISADLNLATLQLIGAQRRRIDVGRLAINGMAEQHFLLMAGLGLDGAVVAGLSDRLKARVGMLAYAPAIFDAVRHFPRTPMTVDLDGVAWKGDVVQMIAGNTRRYASVTSLTPEAFIDDGRLDVCLLTPSGFPAIARQLGSLLLRRRPDRGSAVSDRVGQLTVRTPRVTPLQLDGSPVKQDDVKAGPEGVSYVFSLITQSLTVLVPRAYNGALFQTGSVASVFQPPTSEEGEATAAGEHRLRVVAVGIDTITAAELEDGRVLTVRIAAGTTAQDASGRDQPLPAFLAALGEGAMLQVEGDEDREANTVSARRLIAESSEL